MALLTEHLNIVFLIVFVSDLTTGQYDQYSPYPTPFPPNKQNPYNEYGPRLPYSYQYPVDGDYRPTYLYKGRRYGQQNFEYNYSQGRPGDPRIRGQDERFSYDRVCRTKICNSN